MTMLDWITKKFGELSSITEYPTGGQKWVFGANHATDGEVVLKLIKPTTQLDRVQREVLAVKQVKSARVPRIFAEGVLDKTPWGDDLIWLREQRINGATVRALLTQGLCSARDDILSLGLHVLEALSDAERARIVHRDVKPENIIRANDGAFWLLDFGIARHLDMASLTVTGLGGPGTVGYAPPEQYRNKKRELDARADLFALAVTLVEAISGVHPYRNGARDASEVIRKIESAPLPLPRIPWDKGRKFADLLASMGQRRMDCRPSSAAEALVWMTEVNTALRG